MDISKLEKNFYTLFAGLKEEKNKYYTPDFNNKRIYYLFENEEEFNNYFKRYGVNNDDDLFKLCKYKTLSNGNIISLKGICDYTIKKYLVDTLEYRVKIQQLMLTKEKVDQIHSRGNITFMEKVDELESMDHCAPGDSGYRCNTFKSCHDCLLELASHQLEHPKFDLKLLSNDEYSIDDVNVRTRKLNNNNKPKSS